MFLITVLGDVGEHRSASVRVVCAGFRAVAPPLAKEIGDTAARLDKLRRDSSSPDR